MTTSTNKPIDIFFTPVYISYISNSERRATKVTVRVKMSGTTAVELGLTPGFSEVEVDLPYHLVLPGSPNQTSKEVAITEDGVLRIGAPYSDIYLSPEQAKLLREYLNAATKAGYLE